MTIPRKISIPLFLRENLLNACEGAGYLFILSHSHFECLKSVALYVGVELKAFVRTNSVYR